MRFKQGEWQRQILQDYCFNLWSEQWSHGRVVRGSTIFAGGCWGTGSILGVDTSIFFSFIVFLRFGFLLFILTADPVSFARFLRKRISSIIYKGID